MTFNRDTLLIALGFAIVLVAAYVILAITGHYDGTFVTFLVTIGGLVGLGGHQAATAKAQTKTLTKIDQQTNGVLTQRIKDAVAEALDTAATVPKPKTKSTVNT